MSNLFTSSIGKKLVMSLSGLFLILFLLVHLGANLTVFGGESAYNAMCEFMDTNIFIRIMVPVLALGFIIHILYAFIVTLNNRKARGNMRYAVQDLSKSSTWESRNMLVLGIIVLGIIIIHLFDFWSQMGWNRDFAKLKVFVDMGHVDIYNVNASFFYYVLRNDVPDVGCLLQRAVRSHVPVRQRL